MIFKTNKNIFYGDFCRFLSFTSETVNKALYMVYQINLFHKKFSVESDAASQKLKKNVT